MCKMRLHVCTKNSHPAEVWIGWQEACSSLPYTYRLSQVPKPYVFIVAHVFPSRYGKARVAVAFYDRDLDEAIEAFCGAWGSTQILPSCINGSRFRLKLGTVSGLLTFLFQLQILILIVHTFVSYASSMLLVCWASKVWFSRVFFTHLDVFEIFYFECTFLLVLNYRFSVFFFLFRL